MQQANTFKNYIWLMGGRIRAFQCQALSKRSKLQCKNAALKDKRVCRFHGGKSTGPLTIHGKQRCVEAKTIHGRETREKRKVRAEKFKEIKIYFRKYQSSFVKQNY
ncbi:hypothetical protein N8011_01195 [Pseudomonadota bacterium]|nr:hypothetical protein [Pseudomonadota bacterium]